MTTATISIYTFADLPTEEAKDKARLWVMEAYSHYDWWDSTIDQWKADLEETYGIHNPNILWSGFYSQGDGACFTGECNIFAFVNRSADHEKPLFAKVLAEIEENGLSPVVNLERFTHHYQHHMTIHAHYEDFHSLEEQDEMEALTQSILEEARGLMQKIFVELRDEYEYMCSDEEIAETCAANEYYFNRLGNPIHHLIEEIAA